MCPCIRSGPTDLSINRTNLSLIMLDNVTGENCGEVAYARGLANHPMLDVPAVANIANVCNEAGIYMDPTDVSSSDDNVACEADDERSFHGFSTSPPTDSDAQPSPHPDACAPGPSFQDILEASRQAALRLRHPGTPPGYPTPEALHATPSPADSPQDRDTQEDEISPYRTRSGTIRVPAPPKKKGK